jgi:acyl carrier protein
MAHFDQTDTYAKVVDIISEVLTIDKSSITMASTFESLGADSLDMLEIIMKIEEVFGIEIPDDESARITSIAQAVEKIQAARTK